MIRTIVWCHRGFPIQWFASDGKNYFENDAIQGVEDDFPFRGGLPLTIWHSALTEAMHWAYNPEQDPPDGWRDATSDELLLCVVSDDEGDAE